MNRNFTENAWEDFEYWIANDKKIVKKIISLLKDIVLVKQNGTTSV